jgi:subtilisin family serine protease
MVIVRIRCTALVAGVLLAVVPIPARASDDSYSDRQWGLRKVGAEQAWGAGRGAGITIAVVDTGVDLKHPDLAGSFVPGYDFVGDDADPSDRNGHGTHVAGIAAARADNGIGVAGVAPEAEIMPIRVINSKGRGLASDVEDGVKWAVEHGADVLNLSFSAGVVIEGLSGGSMTDLLSYAWSKGVVPVVSSGNGGLFRTDSSDAKALVVTATTTDDERAPYATSVGLAPWGIAAPGGDDHDGNASKVISTYWNEKTGSGYGWGTGTSMAAPHVAGAAAVLRGLGLTPQQTVDRILSTAKDIGSAGDDFTFGHGLLDVGAATKGLGERTASSSPTTATDDGPDTDPAPAAGQVASPQAQPRSSRPAPAGPEATRTRTDSPSPLGRLIASDEKSERSALANLLLAGTLLGAAGALVGFGSWQRVRARRRGT